MSNYIGETPVTISESEYKDYTPSDWALLWIEMYSGIDGSHHKQWLVDQTSRILKGTTVELSIAKWDDGTVDERFTLGEPTKAYHDWVKQYEDGEDGPDTYSYDCGVAP